MSPFSIWASIASFIKSDVVFVTWVLARERIASLYFARNKINNPTAIMTSISKKRTSRRKPRRIQITPKDYMRITSGYDKRFICGEAVLAISFFVPILSKAISRSASEPIFMTESTMPRPKAVC